MLNADPLTPRPTLTNPNLLASTLEALGRTAATSSEVWHRLTESYIVDLDAVAALLPSCEPEPLWLNARG
ncbi:hypothetical protein [Methylobacterium organophilum]|uniref:Uncharacterized protein n=1 Tax=Methylobacterium organophilum TaxID=410 RepID=A0ABQ4T4X9_METOR|nr:hypothetical protein [Methylobacterium organophilum]UMY17780.1 hypothetical protein MMB17_24805 [Methylobacterium organophilum]GJE25985.1 hypothetical protein LKMONMHP_0829 [Methylobacterium organophilum]